MIIDETLTRFTCLDIGKFVDGTAQLHDRGIELTDWQHVIKWCPVFHCPQADFGLGGVGGRATFSARRKYSKRSSA